MRLLLLPLFLAACLSTAVFIYLGLHSEIAPQRVPARAYDPLL